jgi:MFS family permease
MAIIETSWSATKKDLRLFGVVGAIVFGLVGVGALTGTAWMSGYVGKLLSWPVMLILAVLCGISFTMVGRKKKIPEEMRHYTLAGAAIFALLAILFKTGTLAPGAWGLIVIAAFFLIGGFVLPDLLKPVFFVFMVATFPLGLVMGPLILGVIFYGVFTPVALFFKAIGRDTMTRKFDPAAKTYWVEHKDAEPKRYFRQF